MFDGILQPTHWIFILAIIVILFGGQKLPELGKGLGQAIRGFKTALRDDGSEDESTKTLPAKDSRTPGTR